ncbi:mechanosensitive ion channel family protein [Solimonas soli]|uniref:mechanosensitive ion channel family protein n=1 Tax=Solimonas soli TaxID=413479 RepID=UPI0004AF9735|nr:mechanosensitive ion channel domain-containing protein [Solimonas soli]
MAALRDSFGIVDTVLFTVGDNVVTIGTLLALLVASLLLLTVARVLQNRLLRHLLRRSHLDRSMQQTIGTLVHYAVLTIGFIIIMQNVGIDLSAFGVLAGALGVGVGFGLQNIFSNVISGVIVMFERPVRIGDRIEIGGNEGDVIAIRARSTVLRTSRGATVIVPNQKFITEYVKNWESRGELSSLLLPFRIVREHDVEEIRAAIGEALKSRPEPALDPPPRVFFTGADAGGYQFEAQVWLDGDPMQRAEMQTGLMIEVHRRLARRGMKLA